MKHHINEVKIQYSFDKNTEQARKRRKLSQNIKQYKGKDNCLHLINGERLKGFPPRK